MPAPQTIETLAYLKRHGSITPLEALRELGVMRLGARIYDLREAGHSIEREMVEVPTRDGTTRVARYRLARGVAGC